MKKILNIIIIFLPWAIRRRLLNIFYHYKIHPKAKIGLSYIYPKHLIMEEGAYIGHLNVAIHLELIHMGKDCTISQKNWITGFPIADKSNFQDFPNRKPYLIMGKDSAITKQHLIDCTDTVTITIGHHCFIGTRSIILPGSILPNQAVLGAGAVLKKQFTESFSLYGGVPAKFIKKMDENYAFFHRTYRPK